MQVAADVPTLDEIVADLRTLRERGLVRIRHTDLDDLAARSAAHDFEAAYLYLEQVAFPGYTHPVQRLDVVLFRDQGEFHGFWPHDMQGFYVDRPPQDLERARRRLSR